MGPFGEVVMRVRSDEHDRTNMWMPWNEQTRVIAETSIARGFAQWAPDTEQGNTHAGQH
jgi:hypothetical protein